MLFEFKTYDEIYNCFQLFSRKTLEFVLEKNVGGGKREESGLSNEFNDEG